MLAALGIGAGTAGYVLYHESEVSSLQKKKVTLEKAATQERNQLRAYESQISEQHSLIKALQQQGELERKAMVDLGGSLKAARDKVAQLEAQQQQTEADMQRLEREAAEAQAKIDSIRSSAEKLQQKQASTEQNIKLMQQEVVKAKELVNPLNHPKVRNLLGR